MTADHFDEVIRILLGRRPFRVFTVVLRGGGTCEIDHPEALHLVEDVAVFVSPGGVRIYMDHESINHIVDAPAHSAPGGQTS